MDAADRKDVRTVGASTSIYDPFLSPRRDINYNYKQRGIRNL